jgi:hypothetical protein
MKVVELAMVAMASLVLSAISLFGHMANRLNSLLGVYGGLRVARFFL